MKEIDFMKLKSGHKKEALREVQLLKKVQNPHVIKYYTSFVENESLFIIMEYADGGDLSKIV